LVFIQPPYSSDVVEGEWYTDFVDEDRGRGIWEKRPFTKTPHHF